MVNNRPKKANRKSKAPQKEEAAVSQASKNIADAMGGALAEERARMASDAHDDIYSQLFDRAISIEDDTEQEALAELYVDYMAVARAGLPTNVHLMLARALMLIREIVPRLVREADAAESEYLPGESRVIGGPWEQGAPGAMRQSGGVAKSAWEPTPAELAAAGKPVWERPHGEVGVGIPPHQRR